MRAILMPEPLAREILEAHAASDRPRVDAALDLWIRYRCGEMEIRSDREAQILFGFPSMDAMRRSLGLPPYNDPRVTMSKRRWWKFWRKPTAADNCQSASAPQADPTAAEAPEATPHR